MRNSKIAVTLLAALIVSAAIFISPRAAPAPIVTPAPLDSSVVRINVSTGHGSGVYIGNGYVLTAAHVVEDGSTVTIQTNSGVKFEAEVLWANKARDVALLLVSGDRRMHVSALSCRYPVAGELVTARGNPGGLEFIESFGHVAGSARTFGPWQTVIPLDVTIAAGMSGGPLFDSAKRLVGINVGGQMTESQGSRFPTGFSFAVPGATVCELLARS